MAQIESAIAMSLAYIRDNVEGDIAEFGVLAGTYAMLECRWLAAYGQSRQLHLFDSWGGHGPLSATDMGIPEVHSGQWNSERISGQMPPDELLRRLSKLYTRHLIRIHQGYFVKTLPDIQRSMRFALIVIDANLYSSTNTVLSYLFSHGHVSEGAVLLYPGWNTSRASPNSSAQRAWNEAVEKFKIHYSDEGRYAPKGAKFIVHSYDTVPSVGGQ